MLTIKLRLSENHNKHAKLCDCESFQTFHVLCTRRGIPFSPALTAPPSQLLYKNICTSMYIAMRSVSWDSTGFHWIACYLSARCVSSHSAAVTMERDHPNFNAHRQSPREAPTATRRRSLSWPLELSLPFLLLSPFDFPTSLVLPSSKQYELLQHGK